MHPLPPGHYATATTVINIVVIIVNTTAVTYIIVITTYVTYIIATMTSVTYIIVTTTSVTYIIVITTSVTYIIVTTTSVTYIIVNTTSVTYIIVTTTYVTYSNNSNMKMYSVTLLYVAMTTVVPVAGVYGRWGFAEPNNRGNYQRCAALDDSVDLKFVDERCMKKLTFLCDIREYYVLLSVKVVVERVYSNDVAVHGLRTGHRIAL